MHINLSNYKYTHDWFLFCELRKLATIFFHPDEKHTVLEIGSFEGLSACGIIDNLFEHSESHIDCVDPFDIGDTTTPLTENTESIFDHNIARSKFPEKCTKHKMFSKQFFENNTKRYTFIYVDGSHLPEDILFDTSHAYDVLEPGGIMWMDDYGSDIGNAAYEKFLEDYSDRVSIIHKGYQVVVRKKEI
jgi:predicted O-methyltransferase YrrM